MLVYCIDISENIRYFRVVKYEISIPEAKYRQNSH